MDNEISKVVDNLLRREGHLIVASGSVMTRAQAQRAVDGGRLKKVAFVKDLYQDAETGDFWATLDDGRMVRKFSENNGIAKFNEDEG